MPEAKTPDILALWGKTDRADPNRFHPLLYHMLDVAAAAEELWDRLPVEARRPALLGSADSERSRAACTFLAGAHDVGKANRYFQRKSGEQARRLTECGFPLASSPDEPERHGQATGAFLKQWLRENWGWDHQTADWVALAVGGHHGVFHTDTKSSTLAIHEEPWRSAGRDLLNAVVGALGLNQPLPHPEPLNPFLGWLAGFVSVADWLGSHEMMFVRPTPKLEPADYLQHARAQARLLLDHLSWQPAPPGSALSVNELVPDGKRPNALQELSANISDNYRLAIIEAPTGEGKTEAAFALTEPHRSSGSGVYFALPTMATANGLHGRVEAYLRKGSGDPLLNARLLHSQAWLFREDASTSSNPGREGDEQEAQAQDWFAGSKRALLAPYGVGTIDQALIAALRAKHGFVRLFALAGKTIVIDEVHAYDVYMGDLLEVLLGWLRALNCRVVMLSATLPNARREALLRAWGVEGGLPRGEYPCITWVDSSGAAHSEPFEISPRKPLTIATLENSEEEPWCLGAKQILKRVQTQGGQGALVLNTVRDAQNAYLWLRQQALDNIELDLFHARFTAHDRDAIEKRVLERYGKDGDRSKPRILVATQVVEQSLDLDFDHMVSALAPIDLLIQRAGRLHRHKRKNDGCLRHDDGPDARPDPILEVLPPPSGEDGLPTIKERVYSHDVLLRTVTAVEEDLKLTQASDVSKAIETVYSEAKRDMAVGAWEEKLAELERRAAERSALHRRKAERATIGKVEDPDDLIVEAFLDLDETDERAGSQLSARTRLEDRPSITVVLMRDDKTTIHGEDAANPRSATMASVRCTPPFPLWEAFLQIEPTRAWQRKGSLSHARPINLVNETETIGDFAVGYDATIGLTWRNKDEVIQA